MDQIVAIRKPVGPTSHDVIDDIRHITGQRTVGHAGTLDPLASGVLVVGIGRDATRKLAEMVKKEKEYEAEISFGRESTTDDVEGEKREISNKKPSLSEIEETIRKFIGAIEQTPPIYSSVKLKGHPAHRLARRGEKVILKPRSVEIKKIKILSYNYPCLKIRVVTGPGVYIRALARDIGRALGVGAYLSGLMRTRVGDFTFNSALTVDQLRKSL